MSLYQKYRSRTFDEIITQKHVKDILQASLKHESFGHSYLFVGTRGTGKTSLARIFARAINCHKTEYVKEHGEPCNECESCLLSLKGSHIDIIEMDAASNRGIDEVRNLKESVDFLPSISKFKVYIIDETHMMTKEAFNALLKTIEEPPKHIIFIMCTTELFKVPATIISRSQVFELKHANLEELIAKIDRILESENIAIDQDGKKLVAKLGKGSFRDTESILEKVINSSKTTDLTLDDVTNILGLSSVVLIDKVKVALYAKDVQSAQITLESELDEGIIANFNYQLCEAIYEDIVEGLKSNTGHPLYFELFDFLTSVDKDLKNTTNPKLLYIAKLLNFAKTNSSILVQSAPVSAVEKRSVEKASTQDQDIKDAFVDDTKHATNPSALLRQRKKLQERPTVAQVVNPSGTGEELKAKAKFIPKIDFMNYLKDKNAFLFRFFTHNDFLIQDGKLLINPKRQMEKDLLVKPQTVELIRVFGESFGINLKIEFGEVVKKDDSGKGKKEKAVQDLDDAELDEIFN